MPLRPLTNKEKRKKEELVEAYSDFWNNIRFRKGWQQPVFTREEVLHLLEKAADIVIRKRTLLDEEEDGFKMRMIDGSARDFLWSVNEHPVVIGDFEQEDEFVHQLVHATFKDAKGYVEGLTEEEIQDFIMKIEREYDDELPTNAKIMRLLNHIKSVSSNILGDEKLVKHVNKDSECSKLMDKLYSQLLEAENTTATFLKAFRKLDIQNDSSEDDEEDNQGPSLVDKACDTLRSSLSTLSVSQKSEDGAPINNVVSDKESETVASSSVPMETETEEHTDTEDQEKESEEEEAFKKQAEEEEKKKDEEEAKKRAEEERKLQEEEEKRKREAEIQREKEQYRLESLKRQQLLDRAERKKKEEEEKLREEKRITKWRKVKLDPRFDVKERSDGFIITGYLSGVTSDNISIEADRKENILVIKGFKAPSKEQEEKLNRQLQETLQYRYGKDYKKYVNAAQLEEFLLRMGSGEFGVFSESYRLPEYVDYDSIQSSFERGVMTIAIPVTQRHRAPRYQRRQAYPGEDFGMFGPSFFSGPRGFW